MVIARNTSNLQRLLNAATTAADILSLQFRPDKCATLTLSNKAPHLIQHDYTVQREVVPALAAENHYKYLGIPIGLVHTIDHIHSLVDQLTDKLEKSTPSLLAPWQKLDAIRTFVQPCLTYAFRFQGPNLAVSVSKL